ncbi:hypothetical protein PHYSODRAFT_416353, partial [Phytophthora sojae]
MGATQSSSQLHLVREPTALLSTDAGIIVRIPDAATGASTYQHNQRLLACPTSIVEDVHERKSSQQTHVAIVKPGERNQALKGSIVYLKKTSSSS